MHVRIESPLRHGTLIRCSRAQIHDHTPPQESGFDIAVRRVLDSARFVTKLPIDSVASHKTRIPTSVRVEFIVRVIVIPFAKFLFRSCLSIAQFSQDAVQRTIALRVLLYLALLPTLALSQSSLSQTVTTEVPVPTNWGLKPANVAEGERFRLLIVTPSGFAATSSSISDYDNYVQVSVTIATSSGNNCISGYDEMFKAIGSTSSVDARNHTNSSGLGVPIYWLNGSKVADNYNDFFDGSWSNVNPGKNPSGNDVAFAIDSRVWTGSTSGGVEYLEMDPENWTVW